MTQQEQLQKLINKAIKLKWCWGGNRIIAYKINGLKVTDFYGDIEIIFVRSTKPAFIINFTTLLFSGNASFLKSLLGDLAGVMSDAPRLRYEEVVRQLVVLPDNERIPTLYKLIFQDLQG